ncbi:pullulanase X25 domain-containing protein [Jatrophihabitans lederbergiae]|uniref:Amylopullulanase X25 domain-containing protein n=1 Tax=Jatrophihabitans lederbergiae TaxID=3075547 RepID=A0ABU2JFY4_9ACTN|nr:hypothetical protein [Jatrophihabitans sp. DSM 44399]MDT0263894.1 hypothetical protein [Jatrophihabitans sp. DSM 44399]
MNRKSWLACVLSVFTALSITAVPMIASAAPAQPDAVSVSGTFGAQVGCPGDWQPECAQTQLTRRSNDDVWSTTLVLKARSYQYKATLDKSWAVSYGQGGSSSGANITLTVPADGTKVTFYYDTTHWVTTNLDGPIVTAAGNFQAKLGCPADWSPDCLRSWLEDPNGTGVYTFTTTAIPAGTTRSKQRSACPGTSATEPAVSPAAPTSPSACPPTEPRSSSPTSRPPTC